MNIDTPNHKESPDIILRMEGATGVSERALMALRPGLDDIEENLCQASRRETTLVEDAVYSLLGIFSASLPVVFGKGNKSLERPLSQLLTSSGDTNILGWTGKSGILNSCLAADITVFHESPTLHIPSAMKSAEMDVIIARLRASSVHLALVMMLYDRLNELSVLWMKLPCMIFKLGYILSSRSWSERVFRSETAALGIVEIWTREDIDISRLNSLYLIHPWVDFLLDRQPVGGIASMTPKWITDDRATSADKLLSFPDPSDITLAETRWAQFVPRFRLLFGGQSTTTLPDVASLQPPFIYIMDRQLDRDSRLVCCWSPTHQNILYRCRKTHCRTCSQTTRGCWIY